MKVLLIDNGSDHIVDLKKYLESHDQIDKIFMLSKDSINPHNTLGYNLIVLSGSPRSPVATHPDEYQKEIALIKTSTTPIIGICMGFEIISYTYGGILSQLPQKEMGIVEMEPTTDNFIFGGRKSFNVRENHRWVVRSIKDPLEEIGRSKDGIEAVKHKSKEIWGFQFHPETYVEGNEGYLIFDRLIEYFNKKNN